MWLSIAHPGLGEDALAVPDWLHLDVRVAVPRHLWVRNRNVECELRGLDLCLDEPFDGEARFIGVWFRI